MFINHREYITQKEYAKIHGVSPSTVYQRVNLGLIPTIGSGRTKLVKKSAPFPELKNNKCTQDKAEEIYCVISVCSLDICCYQCAYKNTCHDMCLNSPERCGCTYKNQNIDN